jgi:hypothetical protein
MASSADFLPPPGGRGGIFRNIHGDTYIAVKKMSIFDDYRTN